MIEGFGPSLIPVFVTGPAMPQSLTALTVNTTAVTDGVTMTEYDVPGCWISTVSRDDPEASTDTH